jgi:hypothetical protein
VRPRGALGIERWVFAGTGAFLVPWAIVYAASSDEPAGEALLAVSAISLLGLAAYLTLASRGVPPRAEDHDAAPVPTVVDEHEHAVSIWPFVIGGAATLLGFGMAFTMWVAVPAGGLLALGLLGYARESMAAGSSG